MIGPFAWPVIDNTHAYFAPTSPMHLLANMVGYSLGTGLILAACGAFALGWAVRHQRPFEAAAAPVSTAPAPPPLRSAGGDGIRCDCSPGVTIDEVLPRSNPGSSRSPSGADHPSANRWPTELATYRRPCRLTWLFTSQLIVPGTIWVWLSGHLLRKLSACTHDLEGLPAFRAGQRAHRSLPGDAE